MADTLLIIPTFDEKENIEKLIREIFTYKLDLDILCVDDNSPDGTAATGIAALLIASSILTPSNAATIAFILASSGLAPVACIIFVTLSTFTG